MNSLLGAAAYLVAPSASHIQVLKQGKDLVSPTYDFSGKDH